MYRPLLYLNNKEIKSIVSFNDLASIQDGDNSGRTPNLTMTRDILGRVMSITVTLGIISRQDGADILKILKEPNINVKFLDSETDQYRIVDCYCIDPKKTLMPGLMDYYQNIEFILNSNERYD